MARQSHWKSRLQRQLMKHYGTPRKILSSSITTNSISKTRWARMLKSYPSPRKYEKMYKVQRLSMERTYKYSEQLMLVSNSKRYYTLNLCINDYKGLSLDLLSQLKISYSFHTWLVWGFILQWYMKYCNGTANVRTGRGGDAFYLSSSRLPQKMEQEFIHLSLWKDYLRERVSILWTAAVGAFLCWSSAVIDVVIVVAVAAFSGRISSSPSIPVFW